MPLRPVCLFKWWIVTLVVLLMQETLPPLYPSSPMPIEHSHPSIFKRLPVIFRNSVKKESQHLYKNRISFKKHSTETSQEEAEHAWNEQFNFSPFALFCFSLHKKTLQGFAVESTCLIFLQVRVTWFEKQKTWQMHSIEMEILQILQFLKKCNYWRATKMKK